MKKLLILCLLILGGCTNSNTNDKELRILSPFGAPSIALMEIMLEQEHTVNLVNGADLLISSLIKEEADYDIIIAPINIGLNLIKNDQSDYRCLAIVSWGNLYLVSDDENFDPYSQEFAAFGKGAVPEKIIDFVFDKPELVNYFPSVLDVQAQLIQNKVNAAVLAEPVASATLIQNQELKVIVDLQELYYEKTGYHNYPQAALFVDKTAFEENPSLYYDVVDKMNDYVEMISTQSNALQEDLNQLNHEQLGLPTAEIVSKAFESMNIDIQYSKDSLKSIEFFMNLLGIDVNQEMFLQ